VTDIDGTVFTRSVDGFIYLDPPYFDKGKELYRHQINHVALAAVLRNMDNWLLSYDAAEEVRELYNFATIYEVPARYSISGEKHSWTGKKEFIITPEKVNYQKRLVVD
jgi:DNA adenine methylase